MNNQLTQGSITKSLILFSIPMIIGNLLQQFYNVADTFIVGQFLGSDALAAVGSSFTLMTFLTSIILGLCMGSGILFSMYYGGQQIDKMKTSFFISFIGIAVFSILLEILCLLCIHPILHFMNILRIFINKAMIIFLLFLLVSFLLFFITILHLY